jgi:hypothetical protein
VPWKISKICQYVGINAENSGMLAQNCIGQLQNLPVCANSSWNMFDLGGNTYFCCEQGQVGVIPQTGYAGICQAGSQGVPSSLLATMVGCVHLRTFTTQSLM